MKQFACPSNEPVSGSPSRKRRTFSTSVSPSKCITEPAFEVGTFAESPIAKTVAPAPGGAGDELGAAVERDRHEQVERKLALVPADQAPGLAVDTARRELRLEPDAPLLQEAGERLRRDGLRERAVERRDVGQLDALPDAPL